MSSFVPAALAVQLLLAQTAPAADPPTTRGSTPLPAAARSFAQAFGFGTPEPSTLLLRVIHLAYERTEAEGRRTRESLARLLSTPEANTDVVPLPLDSRVWRTSILQRQDRDENLVAAILKDRRAALLYVGLSALDDETLTWLGSDSATLGHVRKFPEIFAAFGRSLHVHAGRIVVPGGDEAQPLWQSVVGADPGKPDAFVERVISGDGRLAFLFDTIAHLDPPHQRFALGMNRGASAREPRLRALLAAFAAAAPEWRIGDHLFPKPPIDGAILLSTFRVLPDGQAAAPAGRRLWDRVFRADELNEVPFERVSATDVNAMSAALTVDAAWLAERVLRVPYAVGRRRLDALLFAQRVFVGRPESAFADVATALRGYLSFPALLIALERAGVTDPDVFVCAAEHAAQLSRIESVALRKVSIAEFQSAVALVERAHWSRSVGDAVSLIRSLCALEISSRSGYGPRFRIWFRDVFLKALATRPTAEETILAAIAGAHDSSRPLPIVVWEGNRYRVDPGSAELDRLQRVRQRQGGPTLDAALAAETSATEDGRGNLDGEQPLADTLLSVVYAIHLGNPDESAVTSGNVALRHDFGFPAPPSRGAGDAWRFPIEQFDKAAWRIRFSILGLETALSRLQLRRLDPTAMPGEPKIGAQDSQTLMLTAALMNPFAMSDAARDEIVAAVAAGRERVASLPMNPSSLIDVARDAGLSEWRRHAVAWGLTQRLDIRPLFSLLELFWLGTGSVNARDDIDQWGAATLPLTGCLCLTMPARGAWEERRGYTPPILATRGADISLQIAETLSARQLPAALGPGLAAFVIQDIIDHAQLANPDDWEEFGRTIQELPRERMFDYIASLTVSGPLVAAEPEK